MTGARTSRALRVPSIESSWRSCEQPFISCPQLFDDFSKRTQPSGVMSEKSIKYRKVVQPELCGVANSGIACVGIKDSDV